MEAGDDERAEVLRDYTRRRSDNSHGVHERHPPPEGKEIEFPGLESLYDRFIQEIQE